MYFKLIVLCLFGICVYEVSGQNFKHLECMIIYDVSLSDERIDYFFQNGELAPGDEHLKCLFNCLGKASGIVSKRGVPIRQKVTALAASWSRKYRAYADETIMDECIPPPDVSTPCKATYSYLQCAYQRI